MGRSKKEIFGVLRDRIWARINGWGEKLLSSAGREVMIKAVLQDILSYLMSCFLVPQNIIHTMGRLSRVISGVVEPVRRWPGFNESNSAPQNLMVR